MSDLIAQDLKLPAHLQGKTSNVNAFEAAGGGTGFPALSITGKAFSIKRNGETSLILKPGPDKEPATVLEVIVLASNPKKSRTYYETVYTQGSSRAPDCASDDGVTPNQQAESPQAKKCAICPQNQWGTGADGKGTKCSVSMRLAVATPDLISDPMLLRVPGGSLKALGTYGKALALRGFSPSQVVTKIGFDYEKTFSSLTFKMKDFVGPTEYAGVETIREEGKDLLGQITGEIESQFSTSETEFVTEATRPKKSPALKEAEAEAEASPKAKVNVEGTKPKSAKSVEEFNDIDEALDNLDFDD